MDTRLLVPTGQEGASPLGPLGGHLAPIPPKPFSEQLVGGWGQGATYAFLSQQLEGLKHQLD